MKNLLLSSLSLSTLLACQSTPVITEAPRKPQNEPVAQDWQSQPPIECKQDLFIGTKEQFQMHGDWLAMKLPTAPAKEILETLRTQAGEELLTRGETHVAVITPLEFNSLKSRVPIQDINQLAKKMKLQSSDLRPVCLGRGRAKVDGKEESTYFIVLKSDNLLKLRKAIGEVFLKRGGDSKVFKPEAYFPHATIGFTKVDLHTEQGIVKDDRSCLLPLNVH